MLRPLICALTLATAGAASTARPYHRGADAALAISPDDWRPRIVPAATRLRQWRSTLFARTMVAYRDVEHALGEAVELPGPFRFTLFSPFVKCPDGYPPSRFGGDEDGVGGVFLCVDVLQAADCVVFVSGGGNHTLLQRDIFKHSPCAVVTFDCGARDVRVHGRQLIVNKCLATQRQQTANPSRYTTLDAAMASLNITRLDALIVTTPGAEYDLLSEWSPSSARLPRQVALRLHYAGMAAETTLIPPRHTMTMADMALFMAHVTGAGYGIVAREDSAASPYATELVLVRVT